MVAEESTTPRMGSAGAATTLTTANAAAKQIPPSPRSRKLGSQSGSESDSRGGFRKSSRLATALTKMGSFSQENSKNAPTTAKRATPRSMYPPVPRPNSGPFSPSHQNNPQPRRFSFDNMPESQDTLTPRASPKPSSVAPTPIHTNTQNLASSDSKEKILLSATHGSGDDEKPQEAANVPPPPVTETRGRLLSEGGIRPPNTPKPASSEEQAADTRPDSTLQSDNARVLEESREAANTPSAANFDPRDEVLPSDNDEEHPRLIDCAEEKDGEKMTNKVPVLPVLLSAPLTGSSNSDKPENNGDEKEDGDGQSPSETEESAVVKIARMAEKTLGEDTSATGEEPTDTEEEQVDTTDGEATRNEPSSQVIDGASPAEVEVVREVASTDTEYDYDEQKQSYTDNSHTRTRANEKAETPRSFWNQYQAFLSPNKNPLFACGVFSQNESPGNICCAPFENVSDSKSTQAFFASAGNRQIFETRGFFQDAQQDADRDVWDGVSSIASTRQTLDFFAHYREAGVTPRPIPVEIRTMDIQTVMSSRKTGKSTEGAQPSKNEDSTNADLVVSTGAIVAARLVSPNAPVSQQASESANNSNKETTQLAEGHFDGIQEPACSSSHQVAEVPRDDSRAVKAEASGKDEGEQKQDIAPLLSDAKQLAAPLLDSADEKKEDKNKDPAIESIKIDSLVEGVDENSTSSLVYSINTTEVDLKVENRDEKASTPNSETKACMLPSEGTKNKSVQAIDPAAVASALSKLSDDDHNKEGRNCKTNQPHAEEGRKLENPLQGKKTPGISSLIAQFESPRNREAQSDSAKHSKDPSSALDTELANELAVALSLSDDSMKLLPVRMSESPRKSRTPSNETRASLFAELDSIDVRNHLKTTKQPSPMKPVKRVSHRSHLEPEGHQEELRAQINAFQERLKRRSSESHLASTTNTSQRPSNVSVSSESSKPWSHIVKQSLNTSGHTRPDPPLTRSKPSNVKASDPVGSKDRAANSRGGGFSSRNRTSSFGHDAALTTNTSLGGRKVAQNYIKSVSHKDTSGFASSYVDAVLTSDRGRNGSFKTPSHGASSSQPFSTSSQTVSSTSVRPLQGKIRNISRSTFDGESVDGSMMSAGDLIKKWEKTVGRTKARTGASSSKSNIREKSDSLPKNHGSSNDWVSVGDISDQTPIDPMQLVGKIDNVVQRLVASGQINDTTNSSENPGTLEQRTLQKNTAELLRNLAILRSRNRIVLDDKTANNKSAEAAPRPTKTELPLTQTKEQDTTEPHKSESPVIRPPEANSSKEDEVEPVDRTEQAAAPTISAPAGSSSHPERNGKSDPPTEDNAIIENVAEESTEPPRARNIAILRERRNSAAKLIQQQTQRLMQLAGIEPSQAEATLTVENDDGMTENVAPAESQILASSTTSSPPKEEVDPPVLQETRTDLSNKRAIIRDTRQRSVPPRPEGLGLPWNKTSSKAQDESVQPSTGTVAKLSKWEEDDLQKLGGLMSSKSGTSRSVPEGHASYDEGTSISGESHSDDGDTLLRLERIESMIQELRVRRTHNALGFAREL